MELFRSQTVQNISVFCMCCAPKSFKSFGQIPAASIARRRTSTGVAHDGTGAKESGIPIHLSTPC